MKALGFFVAMALAGSWLLGALPVLADTSSQAIDISPAYQEIDMAQSQLQSQFEFELTNDSLVDRTFALSTTDFGSLDEEGGVAFLGQSASALDDDRYGLAKWMTLSQDKVVVPAGQSAQVQVTVVNEASLAPGGHYGAVLATAVDVSGKPLSPSQVGVKQVLSSLILLTKEGGANPQLKLVSQSLNGHWWSLPTQITYRFQDSGNVHVVPRGIVTIADAAGRVVSSSVLNEDSGIILPESFRLYPTVFTPLASAWMPGRYTLKTVYRYDGTNTTKTVTLHIWYAGAALVWLLFVIVAFALAGLGWWHLKKRKAS